MSSWKNNRRILLGISGGIAAYKTPELVRGLRRADAEVDIILTASAEHFVSPLVLGTLSGRRIWCQRDFLSPEGGSQIPHIALAQRAEMVCVAPATANVLRRAAQGEAETLLGAALLATRAPVVFFPAMNEHMWDHPATRRSVEECRAWGYRVVEPEEGALACGYEGKGRLPTVDVILEEIWRGLRGMSDLEGRKVVITAGPTWEFLDPVRFLSNPSSGRMGFALARTAWYRGAQVCLISGPVSLEPPHGVRCLRVTSAEEMRTAVMAEMGDADVIVKAAAVGDYRGAETFSQKIKREGHGERVLSLVANPDIAAEVGARKRPGQILVGFAAETENLRLHAEEKMRRKKLDFIAANLVSGAESAFRRETNRVELLSSGEPPQILEGSKDHVAEGIWDAVVRRLSRG